MGNFDVLHPGYIKMFEKCKSYCENFIILLHTVTSIEKLRKIKTNTFGRRKNGNVMPMTKFIDFIHIYTYENELVKLLEGIRPDIRFLGDDYRGRTYTGFELNIPIHYLNRDVVGLQQNLKI